MGAGSSLAGLLDAFTLVVAPRGLDVAITGAVLHDLAGAPVTRAGSVVLLVGVDPARPESASVLSGLTGAAAAVVRSEPCAALVSAAEETGVALLRSPSPWAKVFALVEAASADRAPGPAAEALARVPPGDLDCLADDAAALLGRPVLVLDAEWRLLAHSAVLDQWTDELHRELLLTRAVPERDAPPGTRLLLLAGHRALRFRNEEDGRPVWRIGAGIRWAGRPVGMLWVHEGRTELPTEYLLLAEEIASISGFHVSRHLAARRNDRERRGRLAGQALDGVGSAAACRALGLGLSSGCVVAAVRAARPGLLDAVSTALAARGQPAACVLRDEIVYAILPAGTADAIAGELAGDLGVRVALGCTARTAHGLTRSARLASLVLTVMEDAGPRDAASLRARVAVEEVLDLLDGTPDLLLHELGTAQEETVLTWIEAMGDAARTAARTGLHPNGVRYRVRRLAEEGLDLADPDTRLLAWLRLRLPGPGQRPRAQVDEGGPAVAGLSGEDE
ncbi:PucR family transcriptional regulator [Nonomuraea sp. NPDC050328]|uniref:PucR family transcriptional regulator n=1 Tax=Nonomuraea sp. NPDC050328 TaxID=3364361 RepID=UPI0037A7CDCB